MAQYLVNHTLVGPFLGDGVERRTFKAGETVSEKDLVEAGFNGSDGNHSIDTLSTSRHPGFPAAIVVVKGTEDMVTRAEMEEALCARMAPASKKPGDKLDEAPPVS